MRRVLSAAALRACRQAPVRAPPATANSGRVPEAPLTRPELAPGVSACRAYGRSSAFSSPHADAAAKSATSKSGDTAAFKRSLDLIHFASIGDIEAVKRLVEQEGVPANSADYDKRSALHLAAAEGYLDVVAFLVAHGARVDAVDRWGGSPLHDAMKNGHKEVVQFLRTQGGSVRVDQNVVNQLITAATEDDVSRVEEILSAGVPIDVADTHGRTTLHVAVAKGSKDVANYLVRKGANVNVVDAFGNTPMQDAQRGESKVKREILKILQQAGAAASYDIFQRRDSPEVRSSIIQSLPLLCHRGGWVYCEVWIPSDDETELLPLHEWYADKSHVNLFSKFLQRQDQSFSSGDGLPGRAFMSHTPVLMQEVPDADLGFHADLRLSFGVQSGLAIPLQYNGRVLAVLVFFAMEDKTLSQDELLSFMSYANGLVASGIYRSDTTEFADLPGISPEKMKSVFQSIVAEGVFNAKHIYQEVDWFYRMGIPAVYYEMFNGHQIANHIHCLMAAKKVAQAMGTPEKIYVHTETEDHQFWLVPATYADSVVVESQIEKIIESTPEGHAFSLSYMCSRGTTLPNGKYQLSMYVIERTPYVDPKVGPDESNIWKVASGTFLRDKSFEIRTRYQDVITEGVGKINPIFHLHSKSLDGTFPVTLTFRHDQRSSFLLKFTEVLKYHRLRCSRKFIQTFANGLVVYTFYLDTQDTKIIQEFVNEIQLLSLIPGTSMRQLFLQGDLSVEEYAYAASIRKFVYYFLNQRNEEFDVLATALKGDTLNLGRLNLLATRLRREAVSATRITQAMFDEVPLLRKLFQDFVRCCETTPSYNHDLHVEISKTAKSEINAQILHGFLNFNAKLLKTNFWKPSKAALCFSLDASFIEAASYPENPYIVFFVLAQEFQGFHVRFRDVSRGGIRVIKSANRTAFQRNLEGQFAENYDLAHTQNKKNKDIPEFGSKGTILLHKEAQANVQVAFQKYVSGLLDLLVIGPKDNIINHHKKPELLFLGPDENTADLMEWAARYAQSRSYPYWLSFTTGKPPTLGGVPHDTYGMTTNSVHAYVVKVLEKLGLDESNVTKFQTGGPDGDLGSNEILISKDKTIAIVDGSGVIYDPAGLNRTELVRLATERRMISNFDASLLGEGGFRVLITDTDIVLPNGEKVESGLAFRNEFHLHPLSKADLFVPCGGRPASVNLNNVKHVMDTGVPKWKIVVEGANLFLTQDARIVLEKSGMILFKDASANKGGVTSSSLEVLAALSMSDEEHAEHMQVKDPKNVPAFYKEYVSQIQDIIVNNARLEFECIWAEMKRTGMASCVLTDKVSEKINALNDSCSESTLYENVQLRNVIMSRAIPKRLLELIPLETIISRIPENYSRALFSAWLSSHFIYKYGINAHDFAFFEFVTKLLNAEETKRPDE